MIGGGHFALLQSQIIDNQKSTNFGYGRLSSGNNDNFEETGLVGSWDNYSGLTTQVKMSLQDNHHLIQSFFIDDKFIIQTYMRI